MSIKEWLWKLGVIYIAYLVLYYSAGYFIAWQNPEVRAFYGSPGEALPFFQQMAHIFSGDPWLTPYQLLRALIWVAGAYLAAGAVFAAAFVTWGVHRVDPAAKGAPLGFRSSGTRENLRNGYVRQQSGSGAR